MAGTYTRELHQDIVERLEMQAIMCNATPDTPPAINILEALALLTEIERLGTRLAIAEARLGRVAAMENELSCTVEEAPPKPEALKHVTAVNDRYDEVWGQHYLGTCSACGWSWASYSARTATEKGVDHERTHA